MRWLFKSLAAVLLLIAPAVHAEDPQTYPAGGVQQFLGLDDTSAPTQVADGRAQDLQNVILDVSKGIEKRPGISLIGDVLDIPDASYCAVTGVYYTRFSSGTDTIVATCDNRFYYFNSTVWTQVHGATITSGADRQFVFTTALDNIIGTNGTDAPLQYNGTTLTSVSFTGLSSAVQKAETVAFFKNYLIFANTTEGGTQYATRFRWSNVGTINTWSDEDYIDIGASGGQQIVAMAELYDNLYVFLTDSIYKVSLVGGADTFQITKMTDDIGCVAKNSVQSITLSNSQNGLIFLDKDKKVYFLNGVIAQDISQLITQTLDGFNGSRMQYAVSADTGTDYLLCATSGSGSTNNLCLDLQYQIGEWTKHTGINANAMASVIDGNKADQVYFGNYSSMVYQYSDPDNRDDVEGVSGTVAAVSSYTTSTASSIQVIYVTGANYTTGILTGAPIVLTGGTGSGGTSTVAYNTSTGIVVTSSFSTTPDTTTSFEVGGIDSYYTTKWYDFGQSALIKNYADVYFWAEADVSSTHTLSYATDFSSDISSQAISMSSSTSDAVWGSAIWGVSLWGSSGDTIFRQPKIPGAGRYLRVKFAEDDISETFHIFGWTPVYYPQSVN